MEMTTPRLSKCFSIRFQNVSEHYEPRTADIVVNTNLRKEFFDLVEQFGLIAIYTENDVWHIQPSEDTSPEELEQHVSTWDTMFNKYLDACHNFKKAQKELKMF